MPVSELITWFGDKATPSTLPIWLIAVMVGEWWFRNRRADRKLSNEDRQANREGFAAQVKAVTDENKYLRDAIIASERELVNSRRLCREENDQLRDEVMQIERRVSGLLRKMTDLVVRAAQGDVSNGLAAAVLRLVTDAENGYSTSPKPETRHENDR